MAPSCQIPIQILDMEAATDPTIQAVSDYWCSLNNGQPPRRKAFEFMAVYKAAPHLLLAERVAPETYRFIYCGTSVAENLPRDLTGLTFGPTTLRLTSNNFALTYGEVLDVPCWRFFREIVDWPNAEYDAYVCGAGPLTDEAGEAKYVLSCVIFREKSPYTPHL
jgi:hypothetical protein